MTARRVRNADPLLLSLYEKGVRTFEIVLPLYGQAIIEQFWKVGLSCRYARFDLREPCIEQEFAKKAICENGQMLVAAQKKVL